MLIVAAMFGLLSTFFVWEVNYFILKLCEGEKCYNLSTTLTCEPGCHLQQRGGQKRLQIQGGLKEVGFRRDYLIFIQYQVFSIIILLMQSQDQIKCGANIEYLKKNVIYIWAPTSIGNVHKFVWNN